MPPGQEYESRLNRWRDRHGLDQRQFIVIGNWRLITAIVEVGLAWLVFGSHLLPWWSLLIPLAVFVGLVVWHSRVIRRRTFAERAIRYYERGLARLSDAWQGTGISGERFRDASHPYSEDLDLFGKGSLFEMIAAARTKAGEDALAGWLLLPAEQEEVVSRQQAVQELCPNLDLREDLALLGEDARADLDVKATQAWGTAAPIHFPLTLRLMAPVLAALGLTALVGFFAQMLPLWPLLLLLAIDFCFMYLLRSKVNEVVAVIDTPAQSLRMVSLLLHNLEGRSFASPKLRQIASHLNIAGLPASLRIARLGNWIDWLDSADHILVRTIRPLLLWREQLAMGIEAWRQMNGAAAAIWMGCVAEFEALSSFASLSYERPQWCFPELTARGHSVQAEQLQHPLFAPDVCVPNDIAIGDGLQLLIVSGSNMSGKSTLLRSMGLNVVLAWAGAPVAARRLRLSRLQVATSMRVVDSLQDNRSRFYGEITRIRQVFDLTKREIPVLFLLDELLSGTNSHDRLLGAVGIARGLIRAGAIGLITTHDLALTDLEHDLGTRARNVHFEDRLVAGRMDFDYKLKAGVVTHSNALELMRAVGLDV